MQGAYLLAHRIIRRRRKGTLATRAECDEPRGMITSITPVGDPDDLGTWQWVPTGTEELKSHFFIIVTDEFRAVDMRDIAGSVSELSETDDPTDPLWTRWVCRQVVDRRKLELARPNRHPLIARMFDRRVAVFPAEFLRMKRNAYLGALRDRRAEPLTAEQRDAERT